MYIKKLIQEISEDNVITIYVFGSFVHREMRPGSDIDICVIVEEGADHNLVEDAGRRLDEMFKKEYGVSFELNYYYLSELYSGEFIKDKKGRRHMRPWTFVGNVRYSSRVYGKRLNHRDFHHKHIDERLRGEWIAANHHMDSDWGPGELGRLLLISKFVMKLIHVMQEKESSIRSAFVKKRLVGKFRNDEDHIIHLLYDVINDPQKYSQKSSQERVLRKIRKFLDETKGFCHGKD